MSDHDDPAPDDSSASNRSQRLRRLAPLAVPTLIVVVLLGPHLIGLRSLSPADQLYSWQPWADERPAELTPTHSAPFSDNFDGLFPARREVVERIRDGDWPLWSPLAGGGTDLATNIGTASAAPSNVVALLTPGWYTPALLKAIEVFAAWGFVFLFLRRVGVRRWPATFAGTIFALSGFQVVWVNWPHTRVAALVAGVLWAFDRLIERVEPGRIALAAALLAATVLEGFPAVAAIGIGTVAIVLAVRLAQLSTGARDALGRAGAAAAAAVLGAGLTAVVTVPFASRLQTFGLDRGVPDDAPIARALGTLLAPNALGPAERYFGPLNYIEVVGFIGAPALLAVIVGCAALITRGRPDRRGVLLAVTAAGGAIMLLYSFGVEPIYDTFRGLPLLATNPAMRVKASGLLLLSLAAGLGLDALARRPLGVIARWWCAAVLAGAAALIVAYLAGFARDADAALHDYVTGEVGRAVVVTTIAALALLVLVLRPPWPRASGAAVATMLALVVIDGVTWVLPYWPRSEPEELYPETAAHEYLLGALGEDRYAALGLTFFPGTGTYYGLRSVNGHLFHRETWVEAIQAAGATMRSPTFSSFEDPASASSAVLDRLGTTYWADPRGLARCAPDAEAAIVTETGDTTDDGDTTDTTTDSTTDSGNSFELAAEGPGVRGVTITPGDQLPAGTELTLTGTDSAGTTRSGTVQLVNGSAPATPVTVPVVGLELLDGPLELRLESTEDLGAMASDPSVCMAPDDGLELVHTSGAWIYRRTNALPRLRWAGSAVVEEDPEERLRLLASGTLPDDAVLLSESPDSAVDSDSEGRIVSVDDDDPDRLVLDVESDGPGFVVLTDAMGAGWTASVDGEPTPLLDAEHAGVAVAVDGGRHEVTVTYDPPGLRTGALVSFASLAVVLGLAIVGLVRRRRS